MRPFRRLCVLFSALGLGIVCTPAAGAEKLLLAENGRTEYRIVVPENASPSIRYAAEELQTFLSQMTGAKLPIVSDREPPVEQEILLGDNAHSRQAGLSSDFSSLGAEGYHLKTAGPRLAIAGSPQRGVLYGVYGLLEDHLGCRWFTPDVSRIPKCSRLEIPPLDDRRIPVLEYREPFLFDCFDGDWCARNRMNSHAARLEAKHGGKMAIVSLAHTFNALVPPEKYFNAHPEYFSLVNGKRLKDYSQLCCTNEEVIRLCTEGTLAAMKALPEGRVFSVSQNDCFNYCQCENCQKLAREEESQMAPVLALVNRVAEAVEREFPNNTVETLAYQWTRKPPKTIRPRKNVVVQLCSIECCFSHPLETCNGPENRRFREDLAAWSQTGGRLWVWDYTTDFANYLLPFPNHRVLRENIRFYVARGVTGIFEEDSYETPHSELAALDGYLMAKFLWNPDYDEARATDEFLTAYYGPAAESIRQYLNLLHDRVQKENIHVHVYDPPSKPHLADDLLLTANALWQEAEHKASGNPAVLKRVQISRLSVDYAIVERARLEIAGKLPLNEGLKTLALQRYDPYLKVLEQSGVTRLREWVPLDLGRYRKELAAGLGIAGAK
ncbi:MAG: DUF4838 domain-containing protein [Pirellulales bacterium]|nr:DUF4838 domain-containing protein [Pirellulales bacterium]